MAHVRALLHPAPPARPHSALRCASWPQAVNIRKHLEKHRKDKDSKFRLILVESRIHRLSRYYKKSKALQPNWKYESSTASALVRARRGACCVMYVCVRSVCCACFAARARTSAPRACAQVA